MHYDTGKEEKKRYTYSFEAFKTNLLFIYFSFLQFISLKHKVYININSKHFKSKFCLKQ